MLTQLQSDTHLIDTLEHTFQHAQLILGNVRTAQLDDPTPCPGWTVRDLLGHMIGVVGTIGAAVSGASRADLVLGPDPAAQLEHAGAATLAALRAAGALDRVVPFGAGPLPGRALAGINILDTATHTWDVAIATGQPAVLPDRIAVAALEASRATLSEEIRRGRFAPEVATAAGASVTDQLTAYLGRSSALVR